MTRLLITGGSSYLGRHLTSLASPNFDIRYTFFSQDPLALPNGHQNDLRDKESFRELVLEFKPNCIIHTTGSNRTPDMAEVICRGANHVTEMAKLVGAKLVHLSTDVIFDGQSPPYHETSSPTPLNAYGIAKSEAEKIVAQYENHVIIRTSLIYGLTMMDHSTRWIKTAIEKHQQVILFSDQIRQPVWVISLALACIELAQSDFTGILNVAGNQVMSRAEYGLKLLKWWEIDPINSITIGAAGNQWPLDTRLDLSLAQSVLTVPLLGFDQVVDLHRVS